MKAGGTLSLEFLKILSEGLNLPAQSNTQQVMDVLFPKLFSRLADKSEALSDQNSGAEELQVLVVMKKL